MTTFMPTPLNSPLQLAIRLTFKEAVISEGLIGRGGRCSEDIFVRGKGVYNKIVVLVIVGATSITVRKSEH